MADHKFLEHSEAYYLVKHLRRSFLAKIINDKKPLTIFPKSSITDVSQISKYASIFINH